MKDFDYYFDFGSLASYLAHTQLPQLCAATQATVHFYPMLLGAVFKATGNASPMSVPAKGKYALVDFKRYARQYGVPLRFNPYFPIITTPLMRMVTGLQMRSDTRFQEFMDVIFKAIWIDALDMNQPEVIADVLTKAHFDPMSLMDLANEQATKDQLKEVTNRAVERGVFGAPTFFVGEEMFWGQDRIEQVKIALTT